MISYKALLTKIESKHDNLRTNDIEGNTLELPEVGKSFHLVGNAITEGMSHRIIKTTEIKEVDSYYDN